ncbi:MAG: NFACT family protein, partial [Candidatus Nanohaloarchaea archaeon]|nr:NFACT family protein [Candidatus Nanohaloarchaea archaeon]
MRGELASLDFTALVRELKTLEGARIDKIYQRDRDLTIHIYNPGDKKYRLFLEPGKAFLTSYKRDNPQQPPGFCMFLRKNIAGSYIDEVRQYDFDRVLEIHTEDHIFIAELFGQGNYILLEKDSREIKSALEPQEWSDRAVYKGEEYEPPEPGTSPGDLTHSQLKELLGSRQIVKVLAADLGLGGVYAEEVLERAGIDKTSRSDSLDDPALDTLLDTIHQLYRQVQDNDLAPRIYYDQEGDP